MKKLLTLLLTFFVLFTYGQNEQFIDSTFAVSKRYKSRFIPDGGAMLSDRLSKAYMLMAEKNGIADNIEFGWMSGGASKKRVDGINSFYTDLYDFYGSNDANQTTASSQPYVSGNIAPNEVEALKNPNGDSRYVTHPEISFLSTESWSISINMVNYVSGNNQVCGSNTTNSGIFIPAADGEIRIYTVGSGTLLTGIYVDEYYGKNTNYTITYNNGTTSTYINGNLINTFSHTTSFYFKYIFTGYDLSRWFLLGNVNSYVIRSETLTPSQVAAEHNLLREIYPEIPSVEIGNYTVATTSLEMVVSTNGTVITQATDNTDWATGAARWCYHSDATATGAVYNKLYNKAARDVIIANPPDGWHVATEAELTALAAYGGNALKVPGTDYWATTGGTNTTGFSAIGSSSRNADGTFNTLKNTASFWCADSDKVLTINHNSNTATVAAVTSVNEGHSIRLVKD